MALVAQIDRTFVEGVLAVVASLVLFGGSVYLLLSAVFGLRMAYFVAATAFFGFLVILSALWVFGAPGTPRYLGPKGELPSWVAAGAGTGLRSPTFPEIEQYPDDPWREPEDAKLTAEVEPAEIAFRDFLAEEAATELGRAGVEGEVTPEDFEVRDLRFATAEDDTLLAAGRGASTRGGREVLVLGYKDEGNEPMPSWIALGVSVLGFVIHLPFLDRAERRRKDILTGGDQPPFLGPA
jgi:hypothetical protein